MRQQRHAPPEEHSINVFATGHSQGLYFSSLLNSLSGMYSEIERLFNIPRNSMWFVVPANYRTFGANEISSLNELIALFPTHERKDMIVYSAPAGSKYKVYFARCTTEPHHDLRAPQTQITKLMFARRCTVCKGYVRIYGDPDDNPSKGTVLRYCRNCRVPTNQEAALGCAMETCKRNLHSQSVLWSIEKRQEEGKEEDIFVNFTNCEHKTPIKEYEAYVLENLADCTILNTTSDRESYGDYVFKCNQCAASGTNGTYSHAAFNTCSVFSHIAKEHIRMLVSHVKLYLSSGHTLTNKVMRALVCESECTGFVNNPVQCPTCFHAYDLDSNKISTHAKCSHSDACPKFCIFCMKKESEVQYSCLSAHTSSFESNPGVCPLLFKDHILFSGLDIVAYDDFLHWRAVHKIYDYAVNLKVVDIVCGIESLKKFTADFKKWELISQQLQGKVALP